MHPFLRYPFDIYAHLIAIDEQYYHIDTTTTSIQHGRLIWHKMWANIFLLFHIDSSEIFLRAKIIFTIQTSFNLFAVYYFSLVIFRNTFINAQKYTLLPLALWSSLIWFTLFATKSGPYHLIWSLWYGVNYQITLGLFWYITALTLVLFLEEISLKKRIFFSLQILFISLFILRVHSMEFLYYLMYLSVFILVYADKMLVLFKKYYLILIPFIGIFIFIIQTFQTESSKIFNYFHADTLPLLYETILKNGSFVVSHWNRASSSINELMYLSAFMTLLMLLHFFKTYTSKKVTLNLRMLFFILITSLFLLIPLYEFSSGLFSIITRKDVIHRFYYSASFFMLLPISIYYFINYYKLKNLYLHSTIFLLLLGTAIYSKNSRYYASHNYYRNIRSIGQSFHADTYAFHLNKKRIDTIGKKLADIEKNNFSSQKIYYYARADIAFVIKYIYHKDVYWEGRRANPDYLKHYKEDTPPLGYKKVLFETPKMFPKYRPYL